MAASKMTPAGLWGSLITLALSQPYEIHAEKVSCRPTIFGPGHPKGWHQARSRLFRLVRLYFLEKKSTRVSPVPFGCGHGDAEDFSRFLKRHADKVTQLGQFGLLRV